MKKANQPNADELSRETATRKGWLDRRTLLRAGALAAGMAGMGAGIARAAETHWRRCARLDEDARTLSCQPTGCLPSSRRRCSAPLRYFPDEPGTGASRTPLQLLEGTITPNGLHFERHHNGVPDIDPSHHELVIHGLVKRPLAFSVETLMRYPMESQIRFLECSGNSGSFNQPEPQQTTAGGLNGLLSCSEWTGVRLAALLEEAEVAREAKWVIAEGADAAAMSRSVPLEKCLDDAMIALYQNGEAIRPEQGYPMRLLLPGFEGNMNVKWLRRLKVMTEPVNARDETSHYTELMPNGKARQYMFLQGVKSAIIKPSFGMNMKGPGFYEISGLAWSGSGRVSKVEVSADGGKKLDSRRSHSAGLIEGADSLSARLAMEWPACNPDEPRHR